MTGCRTEVTLSGHCRRHEHCSLCLVPKEAGCPGATFGCCKESPGARVYVCSLQRPAQHIFLVNLKQQESPEGNWRGSGNPPRWNWP